VKKLIVLGIAAALLITGCGKTTVSARHDAAYVAMGDSGTSGAGIAPVANEGCKRSKRNYPSLLAAKLGYTLADVSCGGAKTTDLTGKQKTTDHRLRAPQLDALSPKTRLVTLGIGLNDSNLAFTLLYLCIEVSGKVSSTCTQYLSLPEAGFDPYLAKLAASVTASIAAIKKKAPHARIVLVDYPRYAPDTGECPDRMPMPALAVARARTVMAEVSRRYREIAAATGALFADMYDASAGHDVCSADPWVHGVQGSETDGAVLHPYPAYHEAVADRIAELLGKTG
jgi:lysophospholipase L1-like esterase